MGEVIVVTSGKGGVGKTTAAANLGTALALNEHRVVLLDADIGLRNLDVVMGLENRIVFDLIDVSTGVCRLKQALIRDKRFNEHLFLLPAAQTRDKTAVTPEQMKAITDEIKADYDYILVDSPAGIEQGFRNAIAGADRAIVVTTPEVSAVRDADRIIGLLEASEMTEVQLLINRIRPGMVKRGDMMDIDDIIDILAVELIGAVPEDDRMLVATNRGEPTVLDGMSRSGRAFRNIARRIVGEQVPLMPLESENGFMARVRHMFGFCS